MVFKLFAILQKYDFSSKSQLYELDFFFLLCCLRYCKSTIFQANHNGHRVGHATGRVVCDTAKVRFFKQITTYSRRLISLLKLFAILQKYDFSSKSQPLYWRIERSPCCLRYCKSTIFQANHNTSTAVVSLFSLFAILQKYDFSSKSQRDARTAPRTVGCLRYCKSTIFQANHNGAIRNSRCTTVVCDTAKVRFFKQITTGKRDK